jgi:hypothetical protein
MAGCPRSRAAVIEVFAIVFVAAGAYPLSARA